MDRYRVCLAGAPNETALICREAIAPYPIAADCVDLQLNGFLDGHKVLVCVFMIHSGETMDHMLKNSITEEVMTPRGPETVFSVPDVISGTGMVTLTGPDGEGQGSYLNLLTGRHDNHVNTTQTKMVCLLDHCGFQHQTNPRNGNIEVNMDPKVTPRLQQAVDKFRLLAHGYAYVMYEDDNGALARYTIQHYIDAVGVLDARTKVLNEHMFPHAFNEETLRNRITA